MHSQWSACQAEAAVASFRTQALGKSCTAMTAKNAAYTRRHDTVAKAQHTLGVISSRTSRYDQAVQVFKLLLCSDLDCSNPLKPAQAGNVLPERALQGQDADTDIWLSGHICCAV